jgi:RHS repeat-associated protein
LPVGVHSGNPPDPKTGSPFPDYTFFVITDPENQVFEGALHANDFASAPNTTHINLTPPPDLVASLRSVPATAQAGHLLTVKYQVTNSGSTITPNDQWTDSVYLSTNPVLDSTALKLGNITRNGALDAGQSYTVSHDFVLPYGLSGTYYVILQTDLGKQVFELDRSNNTAVSGPIAVANIPPDLTVSSVTAPGGGQNGHQVQISWQVTNVGAGDTAFGTWYDAVILSPSGVLGAADNVWVADVPSPGPLAAGASYTQTSTATLPWDLKGSYTLFVVTDALNPGASPPQTEHLGETNKANNATSGQPFFVTQELADLQVTSVSAPSAAQTGQPVHVQWSVTNTGSAATNVTYWNDAIYVSSTPTLSAGSVLLGQLQHANPLIPGASYNADVSFVLPGNLPAGPYYFIVTTDAANTVTETDYSNNSLASAATTDVTLGAALAINSVTAPGTATSGQPFTLSWTVTNQGNATAGNRTDAIYLSRNQVFNPFADTFLGYVNQGLLASGASQTYTQRFNIPNGFSGPFRVFVTTAENTNASDTATGSSPEMEVNLPPPVGLSVANVTTPAAATLNTPVSITYTVHNSSQIAAQGSWEDAIYLSPDGTWNANDPLVGEVSHSGGVAGGSSYTETLTASLPGVAPGNYYAVVRTDILYNVSSAGTITNIGSSTGTVAVTVPTLALGIPATGVLTKSGQTAYYQVNVAAGQTLKFALSSDQGGSVNNIYVRYGAIPTTEQFDAASLGTLVSNPDAIIDNTLPGTYYVMVTANSTPVENYTLQAKIEPFSITSITPDQGSSVGSVTLTVDGAQFKANDELEIVAPDGTVRQATQVRWVNTATVWATFDLRGLPTGTYDVKAVDGSQTATLPQAFQVTNGRPGQLSVNLIVPDFTGPGGSGTATIEYGNTGNTDIPAPVLDLNLHQVQGPTATSLVINGAATTDVSFLGTNPQGPAGILPPGTQDIYSFEFRNNWGTTFTVAGAESPAVSVNGVPLEAVPINWDSIKEDVHPAAIDQVDWNNIWNQFLARVGATTTSLETALSQDATELSQVGQATTDINTLLDYEMLQASGGTLPESYIAGGTDLAASNTGLGLSLTRLYDGSLLNRDNPGSLGDGWTFTYDISAVTDANGDVFIKSPGGIEFFTRQADGSFVAQSGDTSVLAFTNGVYQLRDINGAITNFGANGKVGSIVDANGNTVTVNYDSDGLLQSVSNSTGDSISFTSNSFGRIASATDSNGQTVAYTYDATGTRLLSSSGPDGVTNYAYNGATGSAADNALTEITKPDGTHQYFQYDSQGRLVQQSGDNGTSVTTYSYGAGQVTVTDASGNATTLLYRADGSIAQVQDALGNTTQFQYNAAGEVTRAVTPGNNTYTYSYDSLGNRTSYTDPLRGTVSATYEPGTSLLTGLTDQASDQMQYSYDGAGNLTGIKYEDGTGTTYQYGADGLLTGSTNARGQTIDYSYDAAGQLTGKTFGDGTSEHYAYDARGNLISAQAREGGITSYTYDSAGRLTSVTDPNGRNESYVYDSAGRLIERIEPSGSATNYGYDSSGRLAELTDGSGNLLVKYTYDANSRVARSDMGNGTSTTYSYDAAGDVTQIVNYAADGSVSESFAYTYDANSRPVTVATLDGTWTYGYDAVGELTHAVFQSTNSAIPNQDLSYTYDAAGNRVSTVVNGAIATYTTNGLDQYTTADGATFTYDADGNLVGQSKGGSQWTFTYDEENQLVGETGPDGTWTYQYDALGNRIATTHNGVTSQYVIDPLAISLSPTLALGSIAQTYDGLGNPSATYVYGLGGLSAVTNRSGTSYFNADVIGDVTGINGSSGNLTDSYFYLPFGETIQTKGTSDNPFQFNGELGVTSDGGGLNLMGARFYDASLGRFISRDPINVSGGTNIYNFVDNNQTNTNDPLGLINWFKNWFTYYTFSPFQIPLGPVTYKFKEPTGFINFEGLKKHTFSAVPEGQSITVGNGTWGITYSWGKELSSTGETSNFDSLDTNLGPLVVGWYRNQNKNGWEQGPYFGLTLGHFVSTGIGGSLFKKEFVGVRKSEDPNDIIGPAGFGPENFVPGSSVDAYTINFENSSTATAPAQHIVINQQLDPNLDWRTFRLTGFGFDNQTFNLPGNQAFYYQRLDERSTLGIYVDVSATVDVSTGIVTWTFDSIDPATGQRPTDPSKGFLPINDSTGAGDGFVSYTIQPKSTVQSGDVINAQAQVVFDTNGPIETPAISNTIDATPPTSYVLALPAQTNDATFEVSWAGQDDPKGSGIANYTILVSEDGGPATTWLANTTLTNALFTGQVGHTYAFSSFATDNAGNVEAQHAASDTVIQVGQVDDDTGEQKALALSFIDTTILTAQSKLVHFTFSGLDPEDNAVVTFADSLGGKTTAMVTANGTATVDLSGLADGTITASMQVANDAAGNSFAAVPATNTANARSGSERAEGACALFHRHHDPHCAIEARSFRRQRARSRGQHGRHLHGFHGR